MFSMGEGVSEISRATLLFYTDAILFYSKISRKRRVASEMILTSVSPKPDDQRVISFCFSQIQFTQYQVEDSIRSNISVRHHKAHYV